MDTTLAAASRSPDRGKSGARKIRQAGRLPAVLYGPEHEPTPIEVDPRALVDMFRKSNDRNTIVRLSLDGAEVPCLVREVQRHPVSREIVHVDFYKVESDRPVTVDVPLVPVGKSKGLSLGGRTQLLRRTLKVRCAWDRIPNQIDLDISELDIGDSRYVSGVAAPEGVEIVYDQEFPVVTIAGKVRSEKAEAAEGTK